VNFPDNHGNPGIPVVRRPTPDGPGQQDVPVRVPAPGAVATRAVRVHRTGASAAGERPAGAVRGL